MNQENEVSYVTRTSENFTVILGLTYTILNTLQYIRFYCKDWLTYKSGAVGV